MDRPLVIAYRGNFSRPFCTEVHVAASLEALGHSVIRLQENRVSWDDCLDAARGAHLFLWTKTWIIDPEGGDRALGAMSAEGIPSASFHLDRYIGLDREAQITEDPFWRTDFVFTADGGNQDTFAAYGVNHFWLPPAVYDAECGIGRADHKRFPHRAVFVGSYPYPHAEWAPYREQVVEGCRNRYGNDFTVWPKNRQPLRGQELANLYASCEVVVGDSCLSGGATRYWSDRIPETLGRHGALVHPYVEGIEDWYDDGADLLLYEQGNFTDLFHKIDGLLDDPQVRALIGAQGQARVLGRDTYKHRMETVLATIDAALGFREIVVPPPPPIVRPFRHRAARPQQIAYRDGHPTDRQTIEEVWADDQYGIDRGMVAGKVVVDVGANIGAFSVLAASLGAARVVAFEPEPGNAEILRKNVERFPSVEVRQEALSYKAGWFSMEPGPGGVHGGGTHLSSFLAESDPGIRAEVAGDALKAIGPVDLLKLDCESGEYAIVQSLLDHDVLPNIGMIVGEWHGPHMPHLSGMWMDAEEFMSDWTEFVATLADHGHLELHGHPRAGGVFRWTRF